MEPLEQAVAYLKRGLRSKQNLDQLRVFLRQSGFDETMINRAAIRAIEDLDKERQEAPLPPTLAVTDAAQTHSRPREVRGGPVLLGFLVLGFVSSAVLIGLALRPDNTVGLATEAFLSKAEFESFCLGRYHAGDAQINRDWCRFLSAYISDYMVAARTGDERARTRITARLNRDCLESMSVFQGRCKGWEPAFAEFIAKHGAAANQSNSTAAAAP